MSWIDKIWPKRAKAKSKQGSDGALVPVYGKDLEAPDELLSRANKRALRGDLEGAIADIDVAIERNPTKATFFYNRGYLHNLSGHYQEAIQDCSEAITLLPGYDEAFYQRGIAQIELGNLDAAIVDLSEVIRLNPFSIKTYYKRANCYIAQEDIQGAMADYTQAILRVPKDFNAYVQRGLFLSKLQEHRTAIEDFSSALSFNPKSADAYYHRGCCYAELGEDEKATQDFNQSMLYDPNQRAATHNRTYALGIIKASKNLPPASTTDDVPIEIQDDDAVVLSLGTGETPLLTTKPTPHSAPPSRETPPSQGALVRQTDVDVLFIKGQQKAEVGDFDGAIADYSKILEYEPENARAHLERGQCFAHVGENDLAADDMNAAVRFAKQKSLDLMRDYNGSLAETINSLKLNLKKSTNKPSSSTEGNQSIEAEIIRYSQEIHRNPLGVHAYFKRAQSRALLGDLEGAIADYTRTISLEPEYRDAYYKRGMLLEALGDEEGATADLNRAIRRTSLLLPPQIKEPPHQVQTYEDVIADSLDPKPSKSSSPQSDATELQLDQPIAAPNASAIQEDQASEHATSSAEEQPSHEAEKSTLKTSIVEDLTEIQVPLKTDPKETTVQIEDIDLLTEPDLTNTNDPFSTEQRRETLLQPEENLSTQNHEQSNDEHDFEMDMEQSLPTYFSDLVLDPCTHEGNDPHNRYCVHCGQLISSDSDSTQ